MAAEEDVVWRQLRRLRAELLESEREDEEEEALRMAAGRERPCRLRVLQGGWEEEGGGAG